jgi:S-methylmethionine-dependent homocysteine/selenocysteine methylase
MDLAEALRGGPVVLDGGLATELERRGHDLSDRLWSARLLRDDPGAIREVHAAFLAAGARVVTTASYQATYGGFAAVGIDARETERLLRRSVELARDAVAQHVGDRGRADAWVAASIGPYGAMLANGAEYTGDYGPGIGVSELRAFHRPRMEVLADAGADVLACETVPSLAEAEALLAELAELGAPAWLSLTVDSDRTRRGEPAAEAFRMAAAVDEVIAVGVNCCAPSGLTDSVRLANDVSRKPVVAYPNRGETWDAVRREWAGGANFRPAEAKGWVDAGARLVGGCCRVYPEDIRNIARAARG